MVLVSYFFTSGIVEGQVKSNAEEVFHVAETTIHSVIREAEIVLLNTSFSIEDRLDNHQLDAIEEVRRYITGLTARLNSPEFNTEGLMSFRAYIQEEYIDSRGWTPPPDYHPGRERWFIDAWKAQGGIARTDPYTGMESGKMALIFSKRLRGAGGGHRKIAEDLMAGKTAISAVRVTNTKGAKVVLSFRRIFTGWYIGIGTPVSVYYHTAYVMAAVLSLLGLAFMSILSFLLIRLSMAKIHSDEENRSKSSFLARMSHEIRTPMNSILGMTELLLRKNFSPEVNDL
jgi:hypothetical protein